MPKPIIRTYSRYSQEAAVLLGTLIRSARKERKLTVQEVAERAGISRGLLQRIEKGGLKCEIGVVFEAAFLVGVKLFDVDYPGLVQHVYRAQEKLALLPLSIRRSQEKVDDNF
jgi:transcriptional regulator with XRE-family HTH domain